MTACKYHSRQPASWFCPGCHTLFCATCVPGGDDNFSAGQPRCLMCSKSLKFWDEGEDDKPFWRISNQFFAYPFNGLLVALLLVHGLIATWGGLMGGLLGLFMNLVVMRYSLSIIRAVAHDNWQPPSVNDALQDTEGLVIRLVGVFVVLTGAGFLVMLASEPLGWVVLVFGMLALPAAIMVLAMTESFLSAINPLLLLKMMRIAGLSYILMWLAYTAVTSAPEIALLVSGDGQVSRSAVAFSVALLGGYSSFVASAMMGYLLYQHRQQFGIHVPGRRGRSLPPDRLVLAQALGSSHVYIQEGRYEDAFGVVERALTSNIADLELNKRLFRLTLLRGSDKKLQRVAADYMRLLFAQSRPIEAVAAWREVGDRLPGYVPEAGDLRHLLGAELARQSRWKDAKRMLVNMHQSHPRYPSLGEAYLVLARVYLEGLGKPENTHKLHKYVSQNFASALNSEPGRELDAALKQRGHSLA
ncbi:MAG: hypothetical protein P1U64_07765 [Alcanivoracaceae bacterium]|nr:hypothetical protein [Alcanivoracaceae bacterium]